MASDTTNGGDGRHWVRVGKLAARIAERITQTDTRTLARDTATARTVIAHPPKESPSRETAQGAIAVADLGKELK